MPIINVKNSQLMKEIGLLSQQLKCEMKNGKVEMKDLTRIDLFTEIGIRRQVLIFLGKYEVQDDFLEKIRQYSKLISARENCFEIHFGRSISVSDYFPPEYINMANHYFGGKIKLSVLNNSLLCKSDSPVLSSFYYRAILSDIFDHFFIIKEIQFMVSENVLKYALLERDTIFLSLEKITNTFGKCLCIEDVVSGLKGFGYKIVSSKKTGILLAPPFFRNDISSESDVLEDVMLFNIKKIKNSSNFIIRNKDFMNHPKNNFIERTIAKELLGFEFKELSLPVHKELSLEISIKEGGLLRSSIIPSLLRYEISNQHKKYPHKLFEIGVVLEDSGQSEKLSMLISRTNVDFNELYSILYYLYSDFGKKITLRETNSKYYKRGSSFDIFIGREKAGIIGVLSNKFGRLKKIKESCIISEVDLESFI